MVVGGMRTTQIVEFMYLQMSFVFLGNPLRPPGGSPLKLLNTFLKHFSAIIDCFWLVLKVVVPLVPKEKTLWDSRLIVLEHFLRSQEHRWTSYIWVCTMKFGHVPLNTELVYLCPRVDPKYLRYYAHAQH